MSNLKAQGFILIDVDVVALNNAGKNTQSNFDNAVGTKKIIKKAKAMCMYLGKLGVIGGVILYKKILTGSCLLLQETVRSLLPLQTQ